MLCELLVEEFGIDAGDVVPEATFSALELDSLSMAELAVIIADQTGKDFSRLGELGKDTTLAQAVAAFEAAPQAEPFVRTAPPSATAPAATEPTSEAPAAAESASPPVPAPAQPPAPVASPAS
ncbi:acyl carrier protein [Embleya sp. NPDC050154]|uniref:acyl carrier protein n=1 Tax=Embleya sp. NPDC050154 TaxID=3363988 RepID=UPI0037969401